LDIEVSASGFTHQMEKDLYIEMGIEKGDDSNGSDEAEKKLDTRIESSEVEQLRKKVEDLLNVEFNCEVQSKSSEEPGINNNSESDTNSFNVTTDETQSVSINSDRLQDEETEGIQIVKVGRNPHCSSGDEAYEGDPSGMTRLYSNTCSVHSTSTAATIAPEEIRSRVKKSLERREKSALRRRIKVKGEASAVTRSRRENLDTIKQCDGIWNWE